MQQTSRAAYHLFGHQNDSLKGKPATTNVEQVLEGGSQQVNHENIVQTLLAEVVDVRDASFVRSCQLTPGWTRSRRVDSRQPTRIL